MAVSVAEMPRARAKARARSLGGLTQAYEGAVPSNGGRGVVLQSTCHMMKCMHGAWQGYASFVVLIGMRRKTARRVFLLTTIRTTKLAHPRQVSCTQFSMWHVDCTTTTASVPGALPSTKHQIANVMMHGVLRATCPSLSLDTAHTTHL